METIIFILVIFTGTKLLLLAAKILDKRIANRKREAKEKADIISLILQHSPSACLMYEYKKLGYYSSDSGWIWETEKLETIPIRKLIHLYVKLIRDIQRL